MNVSILKHESILTIDFLTIMNVLLKFYICINNITDLDHSGMPAKIFAERNFEKNKPK